MGRKHNLYLNYNMKVSYCVKSRKYIKSKTPKSERLKMERSCYCLNVQCAVTKKNKVYDRGRFLRIVEPIRRQNYFE